MENSFDAAEHVARMDHGGADAAPFRYGSSASIEPGTVRKNALENEFGSFLQKRSKKTIFRVDSLALVGSETSR